MRKVGWLGLALVTWLGCLSSSEVQTPEEKRQEVIDHGQYCCTHDGSPESGVCSKAPAGSIYVEDFSNVDASGRGDACGWLWDGR